MKEQILILRARGLTYKEITEKLGCSKGLISYHLNPKTRTDNYQRTVDRRKAASPAEIKLEGFKYGAKQRLRKKIDGFHGEILRFPRKEQNFSISEALTKFGDSPKCYLTGDLTGDLIDLSDSSSFNFDHIVPKSKGGLSTLDNLGLTTRDANHAKTDLTLEEFLNLCEKVLRNFGRI